MIICDTGPLVSAMNSSEGARHLFALALLRRLGRQVVVPWPVLTEVDLLLHARGHTKAALVFGRALLDGVHRLDGPSDTELEIAVGLGERYVGSGVDLSDLAVMAMSARRCAPVLTWDFRHFRSVVMAKGHHWPLLVEEHDLPAV